MNPLSDQEHDNTNSHAQSSRRVLPSVTSNMSSRSFQNNNYDLEAFIIHTSSDTTEEQEQTNHKTIDHEEGVYCFIGADAADSLPPSYDVARGNSSPTETKYNTIMYNIAHYTGGDYDQTNKPGPLQWSGNLTDGYSTSATFLLESAQCNECNGDSQHVYENENIRFSSLKNSSKKSVNINPSGKVPSCRNDITSSGEQSELCVKNDQSQWSGANKVDDIAVVCFGKSNKYDNIEFKKSSKKTNYQNITEDDLSDKCPRYMPMDFKESIKGRKTCVETDNIYVPIMSPTSVSPPDVFDDIYQC